MNNRFVVRLSWSFYDWANSAWSAIIITFIFARYFVDVLAPNKDLGTLYWTWTIGISSLVAAFLSPIFGSVSDQSQRSKFWLILSTLIYAFISCSFWFAIPNSMNLLLIIVLIFIGNVFYEISQIFYNGQLKLITTENNYAKLSGFAWGLGYVGTVVIFVTYYVIFLLPENSYFLLDKATYENIRISFPITGLWILIFSLPLFIYFKDPTSNKQIRKFKIKESFIQIISTFKDLQKYKNILWFLIASYFIWMV